MILLLKKVLNPEYRDLNHLDGIETDGAIDGRD